MSEERQDSHTVEQEQEQEQRNPVEEHIENDDYNEDMMVVDLFEENVALGNRISQLEEENSTHQFNETQYKELAYQAQQELAVMKARLEQEENKFAILSIEHQALHVRFDLEIADRVRVEDAWVRAARRVDQLEIEARATRVRVESLGRALDAAYTGPQVGEVRRSFERGESSRAVRRRLMDGLFPPEQEHSGAPSPDAQ